jgi:serine/threonine protein kinase/formylglycine-generating enzyme required for sulfatase activity
VSDEAEVAERAERGDGLASRFERIDAACDRFESAWRAGQRPRVEPFIDKAPGSERPSLFRELVAVDLELRRERGESPTPAEYRARFPGFEDQVAEAFGLSPSTRPTLVERMSPAEFPSDELPSIPGYEVLGVLGRGGMGIVYRARQLRLDRPCALKMILSGAHAGPRAVARFLAEARTIARLRHPNILQIHAIGEVESRPFLELEYADGGSLSGRLDGTPWKPQEAAKLIEVLARAVGDMHGLGVMHRDLKPANVLLTSDGTPKVADFGLAKSLDGATGLTLSDSVLGTPCYMSPEQAEGRITDVTPAADIYSLGVMLYELLTGRPPFRGASVLETLEQVKSADPVPPSRLVPGLHCDLETICLKSMSKPIETRYETAHDLAADLKRWLAGMPILARRAGLIERAWRWGGRNPAFVTEAALSTLVAVTGIGAAALWWNHVSVSAATARAEVTMLTKAETANVLEIIDQLAPHRRWADPLLARMARSCPEGSKAALHIALAMLPVDPGRKEILLGRLTQAATSPEELLAIRKALTKQGHAPAATSRLWAEFASPSPLSDGQLRAAGALAEFDPDDLRWRDLAGPVAASLVRENPMLLSHWRDVFRPVGRMLSDPLLAAYHDRGRPDERAVAESFLLDLAAREGNPTQAVDYANLIVDTDARRFEQILDILKSHCDRKRAIDRLSSIADGPADSNEMTARLRGRAGTTLLLLGLGERVWPMLGPDRDPGACTELIHDLARFGVDPDLVIGRLEVEPNASARRVLILALGEYPVARIPGDKRLALIRRLVRDYRNEGNPGLHSAIEWLLRQVWGQADDLDRIDKELSGRGTTGSRDWYINSQGQSFSVVRGPVESLVGSPEDEPGRYHDEVRRRVRIGRTFAIAMREVTLGQYLRFLDQAPGARRVDETPSVQRLCRSPECPVVGVDWYETARYCNWLSQQEGIPPSQWCYPREIGAGMTLPADCLDRTGYRLPTDAEWEYACRAGSTSARPDGVSEDLLSKYGWYLRDRTMPRQHQRVGRLKPNALGLFDMLGNVWEWSLDPIGAFGASGLERVTPDEWPGGSVSDEVERPLRGGADDCGADYLRSAARNRHLPHIRYGSDGFRVARTLKP